MASSALNRPPASVSLHATDFYGWCVEQAALARAGRVRALDLANLAEELEVLGAEQEHALESSLRVLLMHLLKWQHQPRRRSRSWQLTILRERLNVAKRLRRNPGLKPKLPELFAEAYGDARKEATIETGLPPETFPASCAYTLAQTMDEHFLPEAT